MDQTRWLDATGWREHLAGSNYEHLLRATRLPAQTEGHLLRAADAVDAMMEQCVGGLSALDDETRRWLRSAKRAEPDARPMARLQNPETHARYTRLWTRFICYCL